MYKLRRKSVKPQISQSFYIYKMMPCYFIPVCTFARMLGLNRALGPVSIGLRYRGIIKLP